MVNIRCIFEVLSRTSSNFSNKMYHRRPLYITCYSMSGPPCCSQGCRNSVTGLDIVYTPVFYKKCHCHYYPPTCNSCGTLNRADIPCKWCEYTGSHISAGKYNHSSSGCMLSWHQFRRGELLNTRLSHKIAKIAFLNI